MPTNKKKVQEDTATQIKPELSIKDEEQFHELIEAEKEKHSQKNSYGNIEALADQLHSLLKQQDSESCLSVITR